MVSKALLAFNLHTKTMQIPINEAGVLGVGVLIMEKA